MKATVTLEDVKALIRGTTKRTTLSCAALAGGIPKGAITEISGLGKTEFAVAFINEHAPARVAWIEEKFSIFPPGLLQRSTKMERILFVEAGADFAWAVLQVLKSQIYPILIIYSEHIALNILRRIQLAAEKAEAVIVWLTHQPQMLWPVTMRLKVLREDGELQVILLKRR